MLHRRPLLGALIVLTLAATGCSRGVMSPLEPTVATVASSFGDGTWELRVDRSWTGNVLAEVLTEGHYQPTTKAYRVVISDDGRTIQIGETLAGERSEKAPGFVQYVLTGGDAEATKLVVWLSGRGVAGELNAYHPQFVLQSERGRLVRLN